MTPFGKGGGGGGFIETAMPDGNEYGARAKTIHALAAPPVARESERTIAEVNAPVLAS